MTTGIAILTVSLGLTALYALAVIAFRNFKRMNASAFRALAGHPRHGHHRLTVRRRSFNQQGFPFVYYRRSGR
ncbi:MAG: hypothetical protein JXD23_08190 [Spirochaetales bacterium]|nr:hypothetical protein [Spirochaetales bacterium]